MQTIIKNNQNKVHRSLRIHMSFLNHPSGLIKEGNALFPH